MDFMLDSIHSKIIDNSEVIDKVLNNKSENIILSTEEQTILEEINNLIRNRALSRH